MQDLFEDSVRAEFEKFDSGFSQNRLEDLIYELITTVTWRELNGSRDLYDRLVALVGADDALLTFNYDLQLDRALERTATWSIVDGYGLEFEALLDENGKWGKPEVKTGSKPELLKLHGSLNWLVSNGYFTNANQVMDHSPRHQGRHFVVHCLHRFPANAAFGLTVSYPNGGLNLVLQLNIVPPTLRKEIFGSPKTEPIATVWKKAHAAIRSADRFVVIGYSLPPADKHAEWLLRDAIRETDIESVEVVLVNPSSKDRERVAGVFGAKLGNRRDFEDFKQFLES